MEYIELTTLETRVGMTASAVATIAEGLASISEEGRLLGCFVAEVGTLDRIVLLMSFDDPSSLGDHQRRLMSSGDPYGCRKYLLGLKTDSYQPFPCSPALEVGCKGAIYEFRTYRLVPGSLPRHIEAWASAVSERLELSPLVSIMHAMSGEAVITHIWPYESFEKRLEIRKTAVASNIWPPKGTADLIVNQTSTLFMPTSFSPLH